MKVFISWSGDLSKHVAEVLHDWIEDVLQGTDAWISTDDIDKGSLWFSDIANGLSDTGVGILALTKDNVSAPWLLFEAGALSKGLTKSRVCPFLVNLTPADLKAPLSQFNAAMPTKEDMFRLVKAINSQKGEQALTDERVQKAFDRWWSDFEAKFAEALKTHKPTKAVTRRPSEDMIEEILEIVRSLQNSAQKPNPTLPTLADLLKPDASFFEKSLLDMQRRRLSSVGSSATLESVLQSIEETQKQREENKVKMGGIFQQLLEEQRKKKSPSSEVLKKYLDEQAQSEKKQQDSKKDKD